jgi:hypothetical protein
MVGCDCWPGRYRDLWQDGGVSDRPEPADAGLRLLVGLKIRAVGVVREQVEVHFDGPVLRALSHPFGRFGCWAWRFLEGNAATVLRYYVGLTVDDVALVADRLLAVDSGEHRFAVPLDHDSRRGPAAAQLLVPASGDAASGGRRWVW